MAMNPISGQVSKSTTAYDFVTQASQTRDRTELKAGDDGEVQVKAFNADRPGINQRRNGWVKVISFGVFNAATLGAVGVVGKLCANSSAMGSQKGGWLQKAIKDYGQTYLNSTEIHRGDGIGIKLLKGLGKVWSNVMPGAWLGQMGVLGQNLSHNRAVNQAFGNTVQREFGANLNYNSVKDLNANTAYETKKLMYRQLNAELQTAKSNGDGDYRNSAVRLATYSGRDSLKAAFAAHGMEEHSPENTLFLAWSSATLDRLDPASPHHDSKYQLSKKELLTLKNDFVSSGGQYSLNLAGGERRTVDYGLSTALGDYEQRLRQAQAMVRADPGSQVAKDNLTQIENERFSPEDSQQLLPTLKDADSKIALLSDGNAITRFKNKVHNDAERLGMTPKKLEQAVDGAKTTYHSLLDDQTKIQAQLKKVQQRQKLAQMNLDEKPNDQWLQRGLEMAKDQVKELEDDLNEVQKLIPMAFQEQLKAENDLKMHYQSMVQ